MGDEFAINDCQGEEADGERDVHRDRGTNAYNWAALYGCNIPITNDMLCGISDVIRGATWEGAGPQPKDGPPEPDMKTVLRDWGDALLMESKGRQAAGAITALHAQRSSDGRPRPFHPELEG